METATPKDMTDAGNRKRKMTATTPPAGLKRGNKLSRPAAAPSASVSNGVTPPVVTPQGSIHTSDQFIDHQRAMFSAAVAPTPHGPVEHMPPTPAFVNRNGFSHTPDGFSSTPSEGFPSNSAMAHHAGGSASTPADDNQTAATANGHSSHAPTPSPVPRAAPLNLRNFANWEVGSRYTLVRLLGKGSYGQVAEAFDNERQKKVAIKKIINVFDQEIDCKRLYREIYILRRLSHPQVINLIDVIPPENYDTFTDLYLVFDFVDTDLHKLIMSPQYLTIRHIQVFLYQLLCGLKYVHSANVIHRDMKPANILLNEDCTLMICDFGLSRVMESDMSMEELSKHLYSPKDSKSPTTSDGGTTSAPSPGSASSTPSSSGEFPKMRRQLTKHVVTRWYRAPELILLQDYDFSVDMWSIGCIFAELLSMQVESCPRYQERVPLFPGRSCFPLSADRPTTYSDKLDQLNVIFNVIGTPGEDDIGSLGEVKQYLRKLPKKEPRDLREMYPGAPADSLDLLKQMLSFNPESRISVDKALAHPFLESVRRAQSETVEGNPFGMEFENVPLNKEALKDVMVSLGDNVDQILSSILPHLISILPKTRKNQEQDGDSDGELDTLHEEMFQVFQRYTNVTNDLQAVADLLVNIGLGSGQGSVRETSLIVLMRLLDERFLKRSMARSAICRGDKALIVALVQAIIPALEDTNDNVVVAAEEAIAKLESYWGSLFSSDVMKFLSTEDKQTLQEHQEPIADFLQACTASTSPPASPPQSPRSSPSKVHPLALTEETYSGFLKADIVTILTTNTSNSNADWKKRAAAVEKLYASCKEVDAATLRGITVEERVKRMDDLEKLFDILVRLTQDVDVHLVKRALQITQILFRKLSPPRQLEDETTQNDTVEPNKKDAAFYMTKMLSPMIETAANFVGDDDEMESFVYALLGQTKVDSALSGKVVYSPQVLPKSSSFTISELPSSAAINKRETTAARKTKKFTKQPSSRASPPTSSTGTRSKMNSDELHRLESRLDSSNWKDRFDALSETTDFICGCASALVESGQMLNLFDLLIKRLDDGNAKVNVLALECMERIVPAIGSGMEQVLPNFVPAITKNLANARTSSLAQSVVQKLCTHADNRSLCQQFAIQARSANSRVIPALLDTLTQLTAQSLDDKSNYVLTRHVLPLALYLLKEAKSGVKEANSRLLRQLRKTLGSTAVLSAAFKLSSAQQDKLAAVLR
ncbi:hypothetical protein JG687_00006704 [Phytophthora cactorum]|uniref:Mitogen-activated protein kinase n=1 Tax=Phytophthora cactorum TaxID=29920 RepID=A0A8T1UIM1_9STRA|nr:hypothetical protein JG687_00006704 [Phytophthora cactorum]